MTLTASPPPKRPIATLRRLWPYIGRRWPLLLTAGLALLVAAGCVLFVGQGLRILVDQGISRKDPALLDRALEILLGVILVMSAATWIRFRSISLLGERVVADLRKDVFARMLRFEPEFFETTRTGELISRVTADTTIIEGTVGSALSVVVRHLLMLIGGLVLLILTSLKLAILVIGLVPLVVAPILIFGRRVRALSREAQDRIGDVGAVMDESLHGLQTVQAFTREPEIAGLFGRAVEDAFGTARRRIKARAWLSAVAITLAFGAVAVILWQGGQDVVAGRITGGDLSAFVFYAVIVAGAVGAVAEVLGELQRAAGATERLMELLGRPVPEDPPGAMPLAEARALLVAPPAVELRDVSFAYRSRPESPALNGVSFRVRPGETVALVGPSGAGKTTLFQLLLGFHAPGSGEIRIAGRPLTAWPRQALREAIGLVAQEPTLFSTTIAENIAFGRPDATAEDVEAAAEAAQCLPFIRALPQGMQTRLGERGLTLSGGQKQRVAIARAILRDPRILLLDEATSALDAESESLVQAALTVAMKGRTVLVIAHRLATIRAADRIVVLDQGRVVEEGRHEELARAGGLYARLAALQFRSAA